MTESFSVGPYTIGPDVLADIRESARQTECPQCVIASGGVVMWTSRGIAELLDVERRHLIAIVTADGRAFVRWDGPYK